MWHFWRMDTRDLVIVLAKLRAVRDKMPVGKIRSNLNAARDRIDVAICEIANAKIK
jgi:hypothetical protein